MPLLAVPVQPLGETEQLEALVEVQEIVALVLYEIVIGPFKLLALISTVGGGIRLTLAEALVEPPALEQDKVKVIGGVRLEIVWE